MKMNILSLISIDSKINFKKVASTHGGEFKGPCPWCSGDDRFTIWPERNRYICRQCNRSGDAIQYLRDFKGLDYRSACLELGVTPDLSYKPLKINQSQQNQDYKNWTPRKIKESPAQWQAKAEAFLFQTYKYLLSAAGKPHRNWLNARGITNETIKQARLGWNCRSVNFDRETWGLIPETNKSGKNKALWLPEGLIIPLFQNNRVVRLRIRQENPITDDRYIIASGSSTAFMSYAPVDTAKPSIVMESELDGCLIQQEASDLINVFAIGNAQARPDEETHAILSKTQILISLDNDEAGRNETNWWQKQYPNSINWPCPAGKDPGEAFQQGVNLRNWIVAGVNRLDNQAHPTANTEKPETKINPTDFIDNLFDPDREETEIIEPKPTESEKVTDIFKSKKCLHGKYCSHLSWKEDPDIEIEKIVCLIGSNKENLISIFGIDQCPKEIWKKHKEGNVESVIIMPRTARKRG